MSNRKPRLLLRAKLDAVAEFVDLGRVFGGSYDARSWRGATGNIALAVPLGVLRPGQRPDADEARNVHTTVSRWLTGARPLAWGQLVALAEYLRLDSYFGSAAMAAQALDDATPITAFLRRLFETGYAAPVFAERALFATRHLLLAAFGQFPMRRDGFQVGPAGTIGLDAPGRLRTARLPQPEDLESGLEDFPVGTRLKARLDLPKGPRRALILLQVSPAPGATHDYAVSCLAPSPLIPERTLAPGSTILPTQAYNGIDAYVVDHPLGRVDWLAVLAPDGLAAPWPAPNAALHAPTASQLGKLLDALKKQEDGGAVEVRHAAFHAVPRPASNAGGRQP